MELVTLSKKQFSTMSFHRFKVQLKKLEKKIKIIYKERIKK